MNGGGNGRATTGSTPSHQRSDHPGRYIAADRVAVVVNGNAKQVTDEVVGILDQIVQAGDLFVSRSLEEGRDIARIIVQRGYPTVLTGGGDGTFSQMVTWIIREAERENAALPRFGLLRLGTGNALAWVVGARSEKGRGVVADLGRVRKEAGSRPLRLLEVDGILAPFAGLGIDSITLSHFEHVKEVFGRTPVLRRVATGGIAYAVAIVGRAMPEYFFRGHPKVRIVNAGAPCARIGVDGQPVGSPIENGDVLYEGPSRMVAVSTIPYWGFGARIFPFADDREDRFSLRVVDIGPVDVAVHIRKIWKGTYRDDRVHDFLAEAVRVELERPMPLQVGGDLMGAHRVVEARLYPRPIRVVDHYAPPPVE